MSVRSIFAYLICIGLIGSCNPVSAAREIQTELTQTQAHLSRYKTTVEQVHGNAVKKYDPLLKKCISNEKKYMNNYYVFYHAQERKYMLFNDLVRSMEEFLKDKKIPSDFVYLRIPRNFKNTKNANQFLDFAYENYGKWGWDNYTADFKDFLLSVNLSFFGGTNMVWGWECTFEYFINNHVARPHELPDLMNIVTNGYRMQQLKVKEFEKLADNVRSKEGNLLQIFIPKNKVDQEAYICGACGIPCCEVINQSCFDRVKGRHTQIAPILDQYRINPTSIFDLDNLQARIVITSDGILNPESGVKIFRFDTMKKETRDLYRNNMKKLAAQMIAVWIKEVKENGVMQPDPQAALINV